MDRGFRALTGDGTDAPLRKPQRPNAFRDDTGALCCNQAEK